MYRPINHPPTHPPRRYKKGYRGVELIPYPRPATTFCIRIVAGQGVGWRLASRCTSVSSNQPPTHPPARRYKRDTEMQNAPANPRPATTFSNRVVARAGGWMSCCISVYSLYRPTPHPLTHPPTRRYKRDTEHMDAFLNLRPASTFRIRIGAGQGGKEAPHSSVYTLYVSSNQPPTHQRWQALTHTTSDDHMQQEAATTRRTQ